MKEAKADDTMAEINLVGFDNWSKLYWQGFFTFWWNHMILSQNRRFQFDMCGAMGPLGRFLTHEYFQQEMEDHENQNLHGLGFQFTRLRKYIYIYIFWCTCVIWFVFHEYSSSTAASRRLLVFPPEASEMTTAAWTKHTASKSFRLLTERNGPLWFKYFACVF